MKRVSVLALSLLGLTGFTALAEPTQDTLHFTMERYPGYFGEYCLDMKKGDVLEVTVDSPYPVRVNLHYHEDDAEAHYLLDEVKEDDRQSSVTISQDGEYCLQITNFEPRPARFELTLDYGIIR